MILRAEQRAEAVPRARCEEARERGPKARIGLGAEAARYPRLRLSFARTRPRGQKPSICEEFPEVNSFLKNPTRANVGRGVGGRSFPGPRAHKSSVFVHRAPFFEKKGAAAQR